MSLEYRVGRTKNESYYDDDDDDNFFFLVSLKLIANYQLENIKY